MNWPLILQGFGLLCAGAAGALGSRVALVRFDPWVRTKIDDMERRYREQLTDMFLPAERAKTYARIQFWGTGSTFVLASLVMRSPVFGLVVALVVGFAPKLLLQFKRSERMARINEQLPGVLNIMASGSRAGLNLAQVIEKVCTEAEDPIRQEFGLVQRSIQLGETLEDGLDRLRRRLKLPNLDLAVMAILVNREKGGDIRQILERISDSVQEISRLEKKVKNETAGTRLSAKVMAGMPVFFCGVLYLADPNSMRLLFTTLLGNVVLVIVAGLTVTGYSMIQKLANPDL